MTAADAAMDRMQTQLEAQEAEWSYRFEHGEYFINVIDPDTLADLEAYIIEADGTVIER